MDAQVRTQVAFHLMAARPADALAVSAVSGFRPALLAAYRDLASLRYDFPVVLIAGSETPCVASLSSIVDGILQKIAPRGTEGERLRRQVLRLEREMRRLSAREPDRGLSMLWRQAAEGLRREAGDAFDESLKAAQEALEIDGEVLDCDADMPARLARHAWRAAQDAKLRQLRDKVERLSLKLTDILKADLIRSEAGRSAAALEAAVGPVFAEAFDFDAMSRILAPAPAASSLSADRRRRIEWALSTFGSQAFLKRAATGNGAAERSALDAFVFDDCATALAAFRKRLPETIDFLKALAVAALEIEGRYVEEEHDRLFAAFDGSSLGASDLAGLPDYLICTRLGRGRDETAAIMDVLTSGVPAKVLVQTDDVLGGSSIGDGAFVHGGGLLASMAIGLGDAYVLQTPSSNLLAVRDDMLKGLSYPGAALFSTFSGAGEGNTALAPYLNAAAALQSRAFPAFSYDPSAGEDLAARFSLAGNPQPDADWPGAALTYADDEHQRIALKAAFTYVDFLSCDRRYARHFAPLPEAEWTAHMVPVADWMDTEIAEVPDQVPYVLMADGDGVLHRAIADEVVIAAARRCRDMWHRLQEFAGLRGAYGARPAPAHDKAREQPAAAAAAAKPEAGAAAAAAAPAPAAPAPAAGAKEAAPAAVEAPQDGAAGEPYIETPRCTSCNECTQINSRMFGYDENKQARIVDASAGTYRQLVEAAESCQVSIIHPGKPRDPNEPGLEELLERAAPFL
jgi:hypothetical protein